MAKKKGRHHQPAGRLAPFDLSGSVSRRGRVLVRASGRRVIGEGGDVVLVDLRGLTSDTRAMLVSDAAMLAEFAARR